MYAATTLDSWARLNLLTATSASDINTLLNTITGAGIVLPGAVTDVLRYYIRARVTAAGAGGGSDEITTVPVIEQIKLHSNRTEINKDGFIEMFGNARVRSSIPISNSSFYPTGIAGETAPSSQQLTFSTSSTNIEAIIPNSLFAFRWKPLENIDIAEICYVDVNFSRSTAGTGNVVLQLDYVFISNNDVIGDPNGTPNATSSSTGP